MRAWARLGFSRAAETARDPPALLLHPACAYMMWFPKRKEERERQSDECARRGVGIGFRASVRVAWNKLEYFWREYMGLVRDGDEKR